MPIYEYQCGACGAQHEVIQKMSEGSLKKCPACGKLRLTRLISAPVFRLKGGGWYETDFKSDSESKRNLHAEEKGEKSDKPDKSETPAKDATDAKDAKDTKAEKPEKADSTSAPEAKVAATPPKAEPAKAAAKESPKPGQSTSRRSTAKGSKSVRKAPRRR